MDCGAIPFNEETKQNIEHIIGTMKCPRKFQCVTNGFENLCRVRIFPAAISRMSRRYQMPIQITVWILVLMPMSPQNLCI